MSQEDVDEQIERREVHGTVNMVAAVVGLYDDRGDFDASGNVFPNAGGSGQGGDILKADIWRIDVAGTLGGVPVLPGDTIRALVDGPAQTAANWKIESGLIQIRAGAGISLDNTDPKRPIISAPGAGVDELSELTDVDLATPPTDGQVLKFDNGSGKWKADDESGGTPALDKLMLLVDLSDFFSGGVTGYTYNNGTAGVGATITGPENGLLQLDGFNVETGQRIALNVLDDNKHTGIYVVTNPGDGGSPYILTRATDSDTLGKIEPGDAFIVKSGSTGQGMYYFRGSASPDVGVDDIFISCVKDAFAQKALAGNFLTIKLDADVVANDNTEPANTGLLIVIEAGAAYAIDVVLLFDNEVSAPKVDFGGGSAVPSVLGQWRAAKAHASTTADIVDATTFDSEAAFPILDAARGYAIFAGTAFGSGSPGTFVLRFAQNNASIGNTVLKAGSFMRLQKL